MLLKSALENLVQQGLLAQNSMIMLNASAETDFAGCTELNVTSWLQSFPADVRERQKELNTKRLAPNEKMKLACELKNNAHLAKYYNRLGFRRVPVNDTQLKRAQKRPGLDIPMQARVQTVLARVS